jgi:hypothetical protein
VESRASVVAIRLTSSLNWRSLAAFWSDATSERRWGLAAMAVATARAAARSESSASTSNCTSLSQIDVATGSISSAEEETIAA